MLPSQWHAEMAKAARLVMVRNLADQSVHYRLPNIVTDVVFIEAWRLETIGDEPVPTQEEWDDCPEWSDIDEMYIKLARIAAQWVPTADPTPDCICDPQSSERNPACPFAPLEA